MSDEKNIAFCGGLTPWNPTVSTFICVQAPTVGSTYGYGVSQRTCAHTNSSTIPNFY